MRDEQIQKWIELNMFYPDGTPMIDVQAFYEGARWMRNNKFSGLFDKNGNELFDGDNVKVFNIDSKIVWELGAFCYSVNIFGTEDAIPIKGSNITIDSNFNCLEIEKI